LKPESKAKADARKENAREFGEGVPRSLPVELSTMEDTGRNQDGTVPENSGLLANNR
jgi:hypothetical protein